MSETADLIKEGILFVNEQQKKWETKQKIKDFAAVKIDIIVKCKIRNEEFAPPLKVKINGEYKQEEINTESDITNMKNRITLWHSVPIKDTGQEDIEIILEPIEGAEKYFNVGKSKKSAYTFSYTRNGEIAAQGKYEIPPSKDKYKAHKVRIYINSKTTIFDFFKKKKRPEILSEWKIKDKT